MPPWWNFIPIVSSSVKNPDVAETTQLLIEPSGSSKVPLVIVILLESPVIFTPVVIAIS